MVLYLTSSKLVWFWSWKVADSVFMYVPIHIFVKKKLTRGIRATLFVCWSRREAGADSPIANNALSTHATLKHFILTRLSYHTWNKRQSLIQNGPKPQYVQMSWPWTRVNLVQGHDWCGRTGIATLLQCLLLRLHYSYHALGCTFSLPSFKYEYFLMTLKVRRERIKLECVCRSKGKV